MFRTILDCLALGWLTLGGVEKKSIQHRGPECFAPPRRPHQRTSVPGSRLAAARLQSDIHEVTVPHQEGATICVRGTSGHFAHRKIGRNCTETGRRSPDSFGAEKVRMTVSHTATVQRDTSKLDHEQISLRRKVPKVFRI